jgi:NADP-dependent 3-hydroxy acid dehydrogenase YdfG
MLLGNKSAVARAFAREGAKVFLAGRTLAKLNAVAREISVARGTVATRTQFLTAKAVAPQMMQKGSGVIMMITATPARMGSSCR